MAILDDFIYEAIKQNWPIYGIEVFKDGEVISRHDFVPEKRHPIYSATKAFTATAVGLAVGEKRLSVDDPILKYLECELPEGLHRQNIELLKQLSIKRFLTMSVPGYPFRPFLEMSVPGHPLQSEDPDWLHFSLSCPLENIEPKFSYSNIPAYLVGAAVENAVGENLYDYMTPRLFEPLGIDKPVCRYSPEGRFYGASGMELTVHELSLLGQLYLQNGIFDGKRILSEEWVKEAVSTHIMNREGGFGYFIWRFNEGYRISGKWGQRCFVFPDKKLMITYLADLRQGPDVLTEAVLELIYKRVSP